MATFPTLTPSSRTYTPGEYPHTVYTGLSGDESRVRHSSAMAGSAVRLAFYGLTESDMLSILSHYQGQYGSFRSFDVPSALWSGMTDTTAFTLTGYSWRYESSPAVADLPCGTHNVEVSLVSVPPEAVTVPGLTRSIVLSIAVLPPATANGLDKTITASIEYGAVEVSGLASTVTITLTAGAPAFSGEAQGSDLFVGVIFTPGQPIVASGASLTVTVSLAAGSASTANGAALTVTASLAAGSGTVNLDVIYLLHMNGSNNSTTFTDSSTNNYTNTAFGDAKISTAQSEFGGASGSFDGTGDYVRTAYTSKWNLGAGQLTIEMWFYANSIGGILIAKDKYGSNFDWAIELVSSTSIRCYTNKTQSSLTVTVPTMNTGTWYHVALVRSLSGGTYTNKIYLDGTSYGSNTMTITNESTDYITIGCAGWNNPNSFFNGFIDELRVCRSAVYTANFTPPSAAFADP